MIPTDDIETGIWRIMYIIGSATYTSIHEYGTYQEAFNTARACSNKTNYLFPGDMPMTFQIIPQE